MVARLALAGTLATVDDGALYQYCCLFAETEGISVSRRENSALVKTLVKLIARLEEFAAADRGPADLVINDGGVDVGDTVAQIVTLKQLDAKHTTQLRQGHMAIRQYLVEFGMTPAARTRVPANDDNEPAANPLDRFTKTRA